MEQVVRLAVVDDQWAISAGVLAEMGQHLLLHPASTHARNAAELLDAGELWDVVILDMHLQDGSAAEVNVSSLATVCTGVVLYTQETRPTVLSRCLRAGAMALVGKVASEAVLADAIRTVAGGQPYLNADWALVAEWMIDGKVPSLSAREIEVLSLFAAGLPLKSVARRTDISIETAKEYLGRVRSKYMVAGRPAGTKTELYFRGVEDGHIPLPTERPVLGRGDKERDRSE